MAGLCGPKILLLVAGLIGVANCNDNVTAVNIELSNTSASLPSTSTSPSSMAASPSSTPASPPSMPASPSSTSASSSSTSASPSSTSASPSNTSASPPSTSASPSNKSASSSNTSASSSSMPTSPPSTSTPDASTPTNHTQSTVTTTTTGPPPPICTVEAVKFGFKFNFTAGTNGSITLNSPGDSRVVNITGQEVEILNLKPDHTYNVQINNGNTTCGENATVTTKSIDPKDIETLKKSPYICYKSMWNISDGVIPSTMLIEKGNKSMFCIQPNYTQICQNLTYFGTNVSVGSEFLNASDIRLDVSNTLPPQITWTNEEDVKCPGLEINYTCQDSALQHFRLDQLEPYTNYNCEGLIKKQDNNRTKPIPVYIKCAPTLVMENTASSNTSISFTWDISSPRCPAISSLKNLSYSCGCALKATDIRKRGKSEGDPKRNCTVKDLKPFTTYSCNIETYFKDVDVSTSDSKITTDAGVPSISGPINVSFTEHNAFRVTCKPPGVSWNGPIGHYIFNLMGHTSVKTTNCDFEFKHLSYSTDYNLSVNVDNGKNKGIPIVKLISTRYNDKALIGFLVFLILITSVALAMVLYKIFILQRNKSEQAESVMLISSTSDEDQLMRVEPIRAEVLLDVYKKKIADEGRLFLAEFQSIPRIFSRNTMKEAKKSHNATKNRYVDILPYDYNRVQLTTGNKETGYDYINASFINGYQEPKKYIAAQGPKDETVANFWRMIWEQKSSIIVMVTRCEEGNRVKCAQYWPAAVEDMEDFEEFVVKLSKEEQCPDYIVRHLTLFKKKEHLEREVTQIQFISWPDHGVPEEPQLLLKLRKRVNTFKNLFSGPIVVHCSAGVGRTGTYIAIDAMMEGLESEGQVDIYGYIVNLRRQRCLMVQVETQYILIHQAMIEHNQFGETEISLSEFHRTLTLLKETGSGGEPSVLQEEFQRLPKYNNWRTCNTGLTEENKKRNRFSSVVPYDYNRVFVKLEDDQSHDCDHDYENENDDTSSDGEDEESMKYINASHIDGYWGPGSLITAQSPLANTTADFWLMVYQKRATAIVMLSDCTEDDTELCFPYWDQDMKAFEEIEVKVTETECTPAVTIRTMHMYHTKRKESRRVKQFHFLNWSYQKLPEDSLQLMDTIRTIKQTCGYSEGPLEGQGPLVVHCSNGSCQSGLFCALWNLMDSGNTESMADVFQVAKALRKQRPGMIKSLEQYQFLYEAVAAAFPVQNGDVIAAAGDAVHIVDETGHTEAELVVGSATDDQLVAGASTPLVERATDEEQDETESKTIAVEAASNGSTVTMEV